MATKLKGISLKITKAFDNLIKFAGEVVKYENEAKDSAKKMEESSMAANIARKSMMNVRPPFNSID
jgi:hypothetical protein